MTGPILVGLDGSEPSWGALETATRLSAALGVDLVAAFVPHHSNIVEFAPEALIAEREAEAALAASISDRLAASTPAKLRVLGTRRPGVELSELAVALDAEMIVVATRGRGLMRSAALGSVAHHLVTHAEVPVLVVR